MTNNKYNLEDMHPSIPVYNRASAPNIDIDRILDGKKSIDPFQVGDLLEYRQGHHVFFGESHATSALGDDMLVSSDQDMIQSREEPLVFGPSNTVSENEPDGVHMIEDNNNTFSGIDADIVVNKVEHNTFIYKLIQDLGDFVYSLCDQDHLPSEGNFFAWAGQFISDYFQVDFGDYARWSDQDANFSTQENSILVAQTSEMDDTLIENPDAIIDQIVSIDFESTMPCSLSDNPVFSELDSVMVV